MKKRPVGSSDGSLRIPWWAMRDLNPRPCPCKGPALPLRQSPGFRRLAASTYSRIEGAFAQRIPRKAASNLPHVGAAWDFAVRRMEFALETEVRNV